ncbi:DUF3035 domain-containing protein [Boseongicola aestuarii]|uniref:Beta-barrel assembly machine subunit BamF n=1 Tax=Boseongicola aestuarii TaxID=1470561 RepID=A0A238J1C4_9RHOB|nr:DUF3035 domain-containing protein [Boseongicola aestuarii]SMX24539.1 hypothetical protein BOA8489_02665 [Boseongicola aestuarii]
MLTRSLMICAVLTLAACGNDGQPNLLNIAQSPSDGPDEFAVLPTAPLVIPEDLAALPAPTPGGTNRTDPNPRGEAIAALGGNPSVLSRASNDGALVRYTGRYGVSADIRASLAAADLRFRQNNDGLPLERLFNVNTYFEAYEPLSLDQFAELERLRRAGIRTSSVPPDPVQ